MHQDALKLNAEALPLVHGGPRLAVPVARVGKWPVAYPPRSVGYDTVTQHAVPLETPVCGRREWMKRKKQGG